MKYVQGCVFLFAFFLPIHTWLSNLFLILLIVASLVFFIRNRSVGPIGIKGKMLLYSTAPFFLLHVVGLLYTDFPEDGYRYLEKCISYLLVPVLFLFFSRRHLVKIKNTLISGLLYGSITSIIILLGINFFTYFSNQDSFHIGTDIFDYYHTYYNFTQPFQIHPTYLGVYYLTGIIFMPRTIHRRIIRIWIVALFGIGFLFLNSRIIFLGILLLLGYRIFREASNLIRYKQYWQLVLYSVFLGMAFLLSLKLVSNTYIGFRLKNIYKFELSTESEKNFNFSGQSNPRMARYISALQLVKEKPYFGHGTADEYPNLKVQFTKDGLLQAAKAGYNSHNQFIGYAVRFGAFGVFFLLFFFIANAKLALNAKRDDYLLLIVIIFCVNLVENYFDRNFGITFSALFFTSFSYKYLIEKGVMH